MSATEVTIALPKPAGRWRARPRLKEAAFALVLLGPSMALFSTFAFYPLVKTFYLGFFRSDPFGLSSNYVGFDQYLDVLQSNEFHRSLITTGLFALFTVPTGLVLGLGLALLAHQKLRGMVVYRTIFSSTVATSVAVASVMWLTLLNPSLGVINYGLEESGFEAVNWLGDPDWALPAVSLTTIWLNLGFTFIVILAGLQTIPEELHESAKIDGAGAVSRLFNVTLPMLSPTLLFAVVVLTINAFQSFGQIDILTQGGPLDRTNVLVYSIYTEGFRNFNEGVAAAQGVALFLIVLVLTLIQFRFLERRVFYGN
ncbi:MAG: sugar ABC transporter permease [Chloroflexi bacterium]|nr:sugar ABC transporter permease [Chloroflexota bacterium]